METTDYCFSFFRKPIQNIEPIRAVGIVDVYRYMIGHYAQPQTEALRLMLSSSEAKRYKATHFDYCMENPARVDPVRQSEVDP